MSRSVCYTVPSDVLSLDALTLRSTIILSFQYKRQAAAIQNVYMTWWNEIHGHGRSGCSFRRVRSPLRRYINFTFVHLQYITAYVRSYWWSLIIVHDSYTCLVIILFSLQTKFIGQTRNLHRYGPQVDLRTLTRFSDLLIFVNTILRIQWARDRWRHVTPKGQRRDPDIF